MTPVTITRGVDNGEEHISLQRSRGRMTPVTTGAERQIIVGYALLQRSRGRMTPVTTLTATYTMQAGILLQRSRGRMTPVTIWSVEPIRTPLVLQRSRGRMTPVTTGPSASPRLRSSRFNGAGAG